MDMSTTTLKGEEELVWAFSGSNKSPVGQLLDLGTGWSGGYGVKLGQRK